MGLFRKSDAKLGYEGPLEQIRKRAFDDQPLQKKLDLVHASLKAFEENRPENFQAFLESYLDYKRQTGTQPSFLPRDINAGYQMLVARPLLTLVERSPDPAETVELAISPLSPFYKKFVLALALRVALDEGTWPVARAELEKHVAISETIDETTLTNVRTRALSDGSYELKLGLLRGCLTAFEEGNPAPLKTFIGAYLEFKRGNGDLDKLSAAGMDGGFVNLVSAPLLGIIEKSKTPLETIQTLTADLSDFYKQVTLDLVLREACGNAGSWFVAEAALEAGADPNTGHGRAILNAVKYDHKRILKALHTFGGDFTTIPPFAEADFADRLLAAREALAGSSQERKAPPETKLPPSPKRNGKSLAL